MNPRNVKLSPKEEAKVLVSFIYHALPWRYIIAIVGGAIIGGLYIDCGCGPGFAWLSAFAGGFLGLFLAGFLFAFVPDMWRILAPDIKESYSKHKEKVQKEALDKADDHLIGRDND